ncbi:MAG: hypothetical protein LBJ72_01400 [Dysgonamonadaceae bacterium]|jgi:hypothetical protein|nr:hypothetical protein [Dysgonamonadaceae bacterium]
MKKKIIFGIVLLTFTALIFNTNVSAISSMEIMSNVSALEAAEDATTTVYCCSPYNKTCINGGPVLPNVMGEKKTVQCR